MLVRSRAVLSRIHKLAHNHKVLHEFKSVFPRSAIATLAIVAGLQRFPVLG